MKYYLLVLFTISSLNNIYSQGYYPLQIGNLWEYRDCYDSTYQYTVRVIKDTTMPNGLLYVLLRSDPRMVFGSFRQSGSKVYLYDSTFQDGERLIYDFSKTPGDTIAINYYPGDTTVVVVAYDRIQNVFGKLRRQWGLYEKSLNSSAYSLEEVTDSIGKTYEISEPGIIVNCLHGAIINGTRYGTITDVVFSDLSYPEDFKLLQNFPNPFNNSTIITLTLPKEEYITVRIFDVIGREIRKLFDGKAYGGVQRVVWDGKNDFGYEVGSGTYIYRIQMEHLTQTKKMILEK